MKKIGITIFVLTSCSFAWGQNTFPATGNAGIGTTTPTSKLSIKNAGGTDGVKLLELSEATTEEFLFKGNFLGAGATGNKLILGTGVGSPGWQPNIMSWRGDGNVGIGTVNPTSKLSIRNVGATNGVKLLDFSEEEVESFIFKGNFLGTGADGNSLILGSNAPGYKSNIMSWRGDGNIGIGMSDPASRVHVYQDVVGSQTLLILEKHEIDITQNSEIYLDFVFTDDNTNGSPQARIGTLASTDETNGVGMPAEGTADLTFWTANAVDDISNNLAERMRVTSLGNVGIGTENPSSKLEIHGNTGAQVKGQIHIKGNGENAVGDAFISFDDGAESNSEWAVGVKDTDNSFSISRGQTLNASPKLIIKESNGNVGIGTEDPLSKLAVDGHIRATEVKVLAQINVPDYVFESDYKLRTLKEVKEYIAENKHLPEIPSAAEIGENGIDLGDMNMRLLKKIEELTLYQIELLEKVEKLQSKVEKLENK